MAACSLTEDEYEAGVPPTYAAIVPEGTSKVAVYILLNLHLRPETLQINQVLIYISPELVRRMSKN